MFLLYHIIWNYNFFCDGFHIIMWTFSGDKISFFFFEVGSNSVLYFPPWLSQCFPPSAPPTFLLFLSFTNSSCLSLFATRHLSQIFCESSPELLLHSLFSSVCFFLTRPLPPGRDGKGIRTDPRGGYLRAPVGQRRSRAAGERAGDGVCSPASRLRPEGERPRPRLEVWHSFRCVLTNSYQHLLRV